MNSPTLSTMAAAIVAAHSAQFAHQEGLPALPPPATEAGNTQQQHPIYQAALQACSQLGFIAHDAHTLAAAWLAQSQRLGGFDAQQWPSTPADFGMAAMDSHRAFAPCPKELGLYAVLPDADWVGRMARAGVPTVQLRFKSEDAAAIQAQVQAAVQAVAGTGARLFINDHWQAALEAGAYGIHIGQEDLDALPAAALERIRSSGTRLGVSTHGYAEMLRAHQVQPSYIALGAIFPTTLKRMATAPQGLGRLAAYVALMQDYPLVAIGGISQAQFAAVRATGTGSIAVVRALVNAPDPEAAAQALLAAHA